MTKVRAFSGKAKNHGLGPRNLIALLGLLAALLAFFSFATGIYSLGELLDWIRGRGSGSPPGG